MEVIYLVLGSYISLILGAIFWILCIIRIQIEKLLAREVNDTDTANLKRQIEAITKSLNVPTTAPGASQ